MSETNIMKYNVVWTERMSVEVEANDEQEACRIVLDCEHDEAGVSSEIDTSPEAYRVIA